MRCPIPSLPLKAYPAFLLAVGIALSACNDPGPVGPSIGTLLVAATTEGDDPDLDGYLVTVDDADSLALRPSGTAELELEAGRHRLRLLGVAQPCSVAPGAELEVDVPSGRTTSVTFTVSCRATGVRVSVTTTGLDIDPDGYLVTVDGSDQAVTRPNGTTLIRLEPGSRTVALTGLTSNCTVNGLNSRTVTIADKAVTPAPFAVVCTATSGIIELIMLGPVEGIPFEVALDGVTRSPLQSGEPEYMMDVMAGHHVVSVSAPGCSVETNPQSVTVTAGSLTRDTVRISFSATCVRTGNLRITAPTTGPIPGERYEVWTCSGPGCFYDYDVHFVGKVKPNGVLFANHEPGTYHIWMYLPANCRPQSFDKQFTLLRGDTLNLELPVACSP